VASEETADEQATDAEGTAELETVSEQEREHEHEHGQDAAAEAPSAEQPPDPPMDEAAEITTKTED
jgi:hypothetical protein